MTNLNSGIQLLMRKGNLKFEDILSTAPAPFLGGAGAHLSYVDDFPATHNIPISFLPDRFPPYRSSKSETVAPTLADKPVQNPAYEYSANLNPVTA